jgi:uncharacterized membrane protein YhdT
METERPTELALGCAIIFVIVWMVFALVKGVSSVPSGFSFPVDIAGWAWLGAAVAPVALILIAAIAAPFIKRGK